MADGSGLGLGSGVGVPGSDGGCDGDGEGTGEGCGGRTGVGRTGVDGGGGAATGRDRWRAARSLSSGRLGAAGRTGRAGGTEVTSGLGVDGTAGWVAWGGGITTGPIEGVGRNGVLVSGSALLPTVADPVLMAARIGIDAVPASSATVSR
ncbi:hypothetical protein PVK74_21770 [Micromonospora chalcea]|uniref:hypothetical protein n=1 Tax=Micromonospora chalcea TaxID=1874 RepID=UPI002379648F|nr:hypothetical protein [Micromonospora chalcea]WDP98490.1 hypothetical protein PVK74_21770 [Micromonospora chalcea]